MKQRKQKEAEEKEQQIQQGLLIEIEKYQLD